MANEDGVKIIITAEDRFSETMKKIDASSKIFGETTKNTQRNLEALEKEMVRLVANGLDPADKKIKEMKANYDKLSQSLSGGDNALKVTNQKWMSLSLVVQDLPYGFRGIQNNLPALVGSFAAAGGAIYFVFSALIAITTSYEKEIKALFITTTEAEKQQQLYNNVVKESGTAYVDAQSQLLSLTQKVKLAKNGYLDKKIVVDEYNDTIGKTIGKQKDLEGVNEALIKQGPAYVEYITKLSMAVAASKLVAQETENIIKKSTQTANEFVDGWDAFFSSKFNFGGIAQSFNASSQALIKVGEKNKKIQLSEAEKTRTGYIKIMEDMYKAAGLAAKKAGVVPEATKPVKEDKSLLEKLTAQYNFYKDNLFLAGYYGKLMIDEEKKVALKEAQASGASKETLDNINKTYAYKELTLLQGIENQKLRIRQESSQRQKHLTEQYNKDIYDAQVEYAKNYTKVLDAQLKVEMKKHKDSTSLQEDDINQKLKMLQFALFFAYGNEKATNIIIESIQKYKAELLGLGTVSTAINDILKNTLVNGFEAVGETLGNLISKGDLSFDTLAGILADGLIQIGKALIMYSSLVKAAKAALEKGEWKAGLIIGIAAVAAGYALKNSLGNNNSSGNSVSMGKSSNPTKKFANGGIISGPTYGLMGEYPGAKSNPEVVAPLDKLKDLMGGGNGGTFLLRGQDLLLSVNRAQKASNLKGQNISLA